MRVVVGYEEGTGCEVIEATIGKVALFENTVASQGHVALGSDQVKYLKCIS